MNSLQPVVSGPSFRIDVLAVSAMENNVYFITRLATGSIVVIDAADDWPAIELALKELGSPATNRRVTAIATTHSHWDHVRALAEAKLHYPEAEIIAGEADSAAIEHNAGVSVSTKVADGQILDLSGIVLRCVHLRGHTPGSIAYVLYPELNAQLALAAPVIFSGDSLFPGGVGNTEQDPQRFTQLIDDVEARLFDAFSPESVVLPGHGAATTLGKELPSIPEWRSRGW